MGRGSGWLEIVVIVGIRRLGLLLGAIPGHARRGLSDGVVSDVAREERRRRVNGPGSRRRMEGLEHKKGWDERPGAKGGSSGRIEPSDKRKRAERICTNAGECVEGRREGLMWCW